MERKQISILQAGPSAPHKPFVAPVPCVIDAETKDGPATLVMAPAAARVLAEELARYVAEYARNQSG